MIAHLVLIATQVATVTYSEAGKRLEMFMPAFSAAVGRKLEVEPSLRNEVICLRVSSAPTEETLGKIAEAFDASWIPAGGSLVLRRSPQHWLAMAKEERDRKIALIAAKQKQTRDSMGLDLPWTLQRAASFEKVYHGTPPEDGSKENAESVRLDPLRRFAQHFFLSLSPAVIADITTRRRIVWSTNATAMQPLFRA